VYGVTLCCGDRVRPVRGRRARLERSGRDVWLAGGLGSGARGVTGGCSVRLVHEFQQHVHVPGGGDVVWLADNSPRGYALYLRTFSITRGWRSAPKRISRQYGNSGIWPGDTCGISTGAGQLQLSWGGAVGGSQNSEIFAAPVSVSG